MKNYLIIGGSSGIGKSLVTQLQSKGFNVYATYNKNKIISTHENVLYHHLDVTKEDLELSFLPDQLDGFAYCPGSIN